MLNWLKKLFGSDNSVAEPTPVVSPVVDLSDIAIAQSDAPVKKAPAKITATKKAPAKKAPAKKAPAKKPADATAPKTRGRPKKSQ
ncbi:hypothetical protein N9A25_00340 [bacterium]|nr:hypothetical protein [bacterium]